MSLALLVIVSIVVFIVMYEQPIILRTIVAFIIWLPIAIIIGKVQKKNQPEETAEDIVSSNKNNLSSGD